MDVGVVGFVAKEVRHLVNAIVGVGLGAALGHWTLVTMMRVEVIVDVPVEVGGTVEPGACPNEDSAVEPFRPVVAIRRTGVRRVIVIP